MVLSKKSISLSILTVVKQSDSIIFRLWSCLKNRAHVPLTDISDLFVRLTVMSAPNGPVMKG